VIFCARFARPPAPSNSSRSQVSVDGSSLFITGQNGPTPGSIEGALTKVSASSGTSAWTKNFSVGGNPKLIFNECWGGAVALDGSGIAVSCGAGIEGCEELSGQDRTDCDAGLGDKRDGAYPRGAGNWQSFVFKADLDGNLLWQRVDSYRWPAETADMGSASFDPGSSAAEWIVQASDGSLAVLTDEVFGFGVLKLEAGGEEGGGGTPDDTPDNTPDDECAWAADECGWCAADCASSTCDDYACCSAMCDGEDVDGEGGASSSGLKTSAALLAFAGGVAATMY
jgi:hypothetical protein